MLRKKINIFSGGSYTRMVFILEASNVSNQAIYSEEPTSMNNGTYPFNYVVNKFGIFTKRDDKQRPKQRARLPNFFRDFTSEIKGTVGFEKIQKDCLRIANDFCCGKLPYRTRIHTRTHTRIHALKVGRRCSFTVKGGWKQFSYALTTG